MTTEYLLSNMEKTFNNVYTVKETFRNVKPPTTREILDNNWYKYWFEAQTISSDKNPPKNSILFNEPASPDILNNAWHKNWLASKQYKKQQ